MFPVLGVLLLGASVGAGGSLLVDDRADEVDSDGGVARAVLAPEPGPITIALAGDVTAGGVLASRLGDGVDFVGPLAGVLRDADLAVVNVDAPIAEDPAADVATSRPSILPALVTAGVDVVSVANDRSLDNGAAALERAMASDDVALVGYGADEDSAYRPFVREVGGHTVAVVAATQLLDPDRIATDTAGPEQAGVASAKRIDRLVAEVQAARAVADTVVAYLHWGTAGETCPSTSQQELAAALVAAGADVVAGPGAGRVQGAGRSGAAAVAFGLGGFLVDDPVHPESGVLLVRVDGRDVLDIEWVPARRTDGVPQPLDGPESTAAVADWESRRSCTGLTP